MEIDRSAIVGPRFARYVIPVIAALQSLGGSARPSDIVRRVADDLSVPADERTTLNKGGQSRLANDIHWARQYLAWSGYIDATLRGTWTLTAKAVDVPLRSLDDVARLVREIRAGESADGTLASAVGDDDIVPTDAESPELAGVEFDSRERFVSKLRSISPAAFERFCQRVLSASGLVDVQVTGQTGDGGIDGRGSLTLGRFATSPVIFQCKRLAAGTVSPSQIRDLRGAMDGRTERAIFLTTGTFSSAARAEAARDGARPIELVDIVRLFEVCQELTIGLRKVNAFVLDPDFFREIE